MAGRGPSRHKNLLALPLCQSPVYNHKAGATATPPAFFGQGKTMQNAEGDCTRTPAMDLRVQFLSPRICVCWHSALGMMVGPGLSSPWASMFHVHPYSDFLVSSSERGTLPEILTSPSYIAD